MKTQLLKGVSISLIALVASVGTASADPVTLFDGQSVASIVHAKDKPFSLAGDLLARDLTALTGQKPLVSTDLQSCKQVCVVIGPIDSPLVRSIARDADVDLTDIKGQWERYDRVLVRSRRNPQATYLLIAGSDTRGTVWGVIDLTREIGVSAWEWWADVTPKRVDHLSVDGKRQQSQSPSVPYRGIFINDEDWALQPWAAKTFEPEVGDIGPKTYGKVFELMWRLKANTLWPGMHASTAPFYTIKGNKEMARDYGIVMATSHAEPMARNNTREWDDKQRGEFNWFVNSKNIIKYWTERANEVKAFENVYTLGLRGKRDSGMFGVKSKEQARDAMEEIFAIQRAILSKAQGRPATEIPQVLTLYKEVLDIYALGLKVPDDVTLVWPEDNYGYINQLSTPEEQKRSGGSGVYYHVSYLGRPHDYIWLGTTHPALIREQMDRAWQSNARRIWVVNVGDIKPAEYLSQYFLDLAFDHSTFAQTPREHLVKWAAVQFGADKADAVASVMTDYYDLAWERRPEFMGGGQTEPTRPNVVSDYVRTGGQEAKARLKRYADLVKRAEALGVALPADRQDAYFQLVLYPIRGAANLNERILKLNLATTYAFAGRASVNLLSDQAKAAHERIVADTATYNALGNGKWKGIMNMAPRGLPVFDEPFWPHWAVPKAAVCNIDASGLTFTRGKPSSSTVTIYGTVPGTWKLINFKGIKASALEGTLTADNGFETELTLDYDGASDINTGEVTCMGKLIGLFPRLVDNPGDLPAEVNRIISISAARTTNGLWETIPGLGSRGTALRSKLDLASIDDISGREPLVYAFKTGDLTDARLKVVGLPVHPLTSANRLRLAVRIDNGPLQVLDFETFGRSEEWKQNVLTNTAVRDIHLPQLPKGMHRLEVYPLDPGFVLDRLDILLDGAPNLYGAPPLG
ncbi:glycosyl hydrolase 115 family protein [Asticcacaulis sp. BYS171W]|uniref:Glycosyl hydrolase 115 family protein n=1 Tax=Asticcacaulis aquaticus TaxID=2984212 RepID=A0ABT5HZ24_9CAUL|nr:glycosyl hydrolase 115 family protein [Asticcacaulis aquaticus]MDC7685309.1 glycosyl hydrolase 115 family protein [Asticcacaulis aquaticus]